MSVLIEPGAAFPRAPAEVDEPRRHRITRDEYYLLGQSGLLDSIPRTELIDGTIVEMTVQLPRHAGTLLQVADLLRPLLPFGCHLRSQLPLSLNQNNEPEPDLCVVSGSVQDFFQDHPSEALWAIEVSDTTLRNDRSRKGPLYAGAGIPEYWIVDLVHGRLEVHRDPQPDPANPAVGRYRQVIVFERGDTVVPLLLVDHPIPVSDLLPPVQS